MPASKTPGTKHHLSRAELAREPEVHVRHPLNPASDVYLRRLSPVSGLVRLALYIARVPPGKESFAYHRHERDEEFIYILSGHGRAELDERWIEVGPGDFMGFPAPDGPAHHLVNPYEEDLVYLMGGESSPLDIGHFPKIGRKLVFTPSAIWNVSDVQAERLSFAQWLVDPEDD